MAICAGRTPESQHWPSCLIGSVCLFDLALGVLRQESDPQLVYGACPVLLQHQPKEMVDILIYRAAHLELNRVTPLLFAALSDGDARLVKSGLPESGFMPSGPFYSSLQ